MASPRGRRGRCLAQTRGVEEGIPVTDKTSPPSTPAPGRPPGGRDLRPRTQGRGFPPRQEGGPPKSRGSADDRCAGAAPWWLNLGTAAQPSGHSNDPVRNPGLYGGEGRLGAVSARVLLKKGWGPLRSSSSGSWQKRRPRAARPDGTASPQGPVWSFRGTLSALGPSPEPLPVPDAFTPGCWPPLSTERGRAATGGHTAAVTHPARRSAAG